MGLAEGTVVHRGVLRQGGRRHLGDDLTVVADRERAARADGADDRCVDLPLLRHGEHLVESLGGYEGHHPLLRLAHEQLGCGHVGFTGVDGAEVDVHAHVGAGSRLGDGAGQARGAEVLDPHDQALLVQLEACLDELLLLEGIAHLDAGALRPGVLVERGGCEHRGPTDAVATGGVAEEHGDGALFTGGTEHELVPLEDAQAHHVHQRVAGVHGIEGDLTPEGRNADGVAVPGDTGDDAAEQVAGVRMVEAAEANLVPQGDRAGPHREDVTEDAADAGRGALVRLDERWVVVALDAERSEPAIPDVDHAGVLTGAHDDPGRLGGEAAEVRSG